MLEATLQGRSGVYHTFDAMEGEDKAVKYYAKAVTENEVITTYLMGLDCGVKVRIIAPVFTREATRLAEIYRMELQYGKPKNTVVRLHEALGSSETKSPFTI